MTQFAVWYVHIKLKIISTTINENNEAWFNNNYNYKSH